MATQYANGKIVTDGLVLVLDASDLNSYTSGSTTWRDLAGSNNGTLINGPTFDSNGNASSIVFDGTSSYADLTPIELSGSFTLSIVFNTGLAPSSSFEGRESLLSQNSSSFDMRGIELSSTSSIGFRNLGVYMSEDYPLTNILPNKFYNITIVRTGNNTINTYVNGVRTDLGIISTQFVSTVTIDSIANQLLNRYFNGSISILSIYNRALSESEIKQNVASLNGRYNFDTTIQPPSLTNSLIETLRIKADGEGSNFQSDIMSSSLADLNRINNLGLLESASLVITPATYKEGLIYNIKPRKSTYNLLLSTETFTGSYWSRLNQNTTKGFLAPDGTNTATLFESTGTVVRMNQNVVLQNNATYNVSWYVSQSNTQYAYINVLDSAENIGSAAEIDFTNKTIQRAGSGVDLLTGSRYTLTEESNGWYRASMDIITTASISNRLYKTWVLPNTASNNRFGTQSGSAVYIWGAQVTEGSGVLPYQTIVSSSTQDFNYQRSTTATTIDRNGYVTAVPYNLATNTNNGLSVGGGTVVRNAAIAPDGTQTADIFTKTGNLSINQNINLESVSPHSGSYYTLSFWTKLADTGSTISFMPVEIGVVSGSVSTSFLYPGGYTITNQWQKVERTFNVYGDLVSYLSVRAARQTATTGPLIDRSFSIWGVQLTKGSGSQDFQNNFTRFNWPTIDYAAGQPAIRSTVSAENFFQWSNDLSNSVWIKDGLTVSTSSILSPSGEYNTQILTATSSNATIKQTQPSSNRVGLFSIYLKRKTGTSPVILSVGSFTSSVELTDDWQRYQVNTFRISGSYTATSGNYTVTCSYPHGLEVGDFQGFGVGTNFASINSPVTNVIDPLTYTFSSGTTTASGTCNIVAHNSKLTIQEQDDEIYVWGPQYSGTGYTTINNFNRYDAFNYVKDFVPTSTAYTNRNNEDFFISDISKTANVNSTSGSLYLEFAFPHTPNPFYTVFEMLQLLNTNGQLMFSLFVNTSLPLQYQGFRWRYAGSSVYSSDSPSTSLLTFTKTLLTYNTNQMKFFINGSKIGPTVTLTPTIDLTLDKIQTIRGQYMLIKNLSYFPHQLTDDQAVSITS